MYKAITRKIEVIAEPFYIESQSDPEDDRYVWGYNISITNYSNEVVQLLRRYWHITDENGLIDEVEGPGVLGIEPILSVNETYQYTSGCPLETPSGIMMGHYLFKNMSNDQFKIDIPTFSLDIPNRKRLLH